MKGNKKLIEQLNARLAEELTAINQYMVHSEMCDGWGYGKLHKQIEKRAIDEMKHAEKLIARILYLEAIPIVSDLNKIHIGAEVPKMHENDRAAETATVGDEAFYVVNDAGFKRHIPAEQIDRQVLQNMQEMMKGSEGLISGQAAKMLGQDDIFTKAMIEQQLKNMDQQFGAIMDQGIPEEGRAYMGMLGFKVVINYHGDVLRIDQPSAPDNEQGGEE